MFNQDVATGSVPTSSTAGPRGQIYSSKGPASVAGVRNELPTHPPSECYFWDMLETCTASQTEMFRNGTAVSEDFVLVGYRGPDGVVHPI